MQQIHEPLTLLFYSFICTNLNAQKVRSIGNIVGEQLVEINTLSNAPFHDDLSALKYIAKEFWNLLFKKNITSLKTDRKNTYILEDHEFKWIYNVQQDNIQYIEFASGLVQGAITSLCGKCDVSVQVEFPKVTFFIKINKD